MIITELQEVYLYVQTAGRGLWRNVVGCCRTAVQLLIMTNNEQHRMIRELLTFHPHLKGAGLEPQTRHKVVCPSGRPASSLPQAGTGWTHPDRK